MKREVESVVFSALLRQLLDVALIIAAERDECELGDLEHLIEVAIFHDERASRAILTLTRLGALELFADDAGEDYRIAAGRIGEAFRAHGWTPHAEQVLERIPYWVHRVGDDTADSLHLLLACVELAETDPDAQKFILRDTGLTVHEIMRASFGVRNRVVASDRQLSLRGPIESVFRPNRPAGHIYAESRTAVRAHSGLNFMFRSQTTATASDAPVHQYLLRFHYVTIIIGTLLWFIRVGITIWSAVAVTPWSLLALIGQVLEHSRVPVWIGALVDLTIAALITWLGGPWAILVIVVFFRIQDTVESSLAQLSVASELADPDLTAADIRVDSRRSRRAARFVGRERMLDRLGVG